MANLDLKNQAMLRIILCGLLAAGMGGVFFFTHLLPFSFPNRNDQIRSLKAEYQKKSTEQIQAEASKSELLKIRPDFAAAGGDVGGYNTFWIDPGTTFPLTRKFSPRSSRPPRSRNSPTVR